jgi:hypothetical protein
MQNEVKKFFLFRFEAKITYVETKRKSGANKAKRSPKLVCFLRFSARKRSIKDPF